MRRVLFYISFLLSFLLFTSCLQLNNEKSASLSFSFDSSKLYRALDESTDTDSETDSDTGSETDTISDFLNDLTFYVTIEVFGDYQNKQTIELSAEAQEIQTITFSDLVPNVQVYVTGSIYTEILEQTLELYSGKTDSFMIHEGSNDIVLSLNKLELDFEIPDSDTEPVEAPASESNNPENTNDSEPDPETESDEPSESTDPTEPEVVIVDYDYSGGVYTELPAGTSGTAGSSESYVTFGMWPQTIKSADVEIDTTQEAHCGDFVYCKGSDGEWYCKHTEDLYYETNTTYSDGTSGEEGRESWFKVEPIMWRVISDYDDDGDTSTPGKNLLVAEKVIYSCAINDDDNARGEILANNYKESRMRAFLNGYEYNKQGTQSSEFVSKGFLQTAFDSTLRQMIETVTVRNGVETGAESGYECEDTQDKVFLLTKNEGNNSSMFPDSSLYKHYCTDFALATSISQATSNTSVSEIWLRTPTVQSGTVCSARIYSSSIYNSVPSCSLGFFPAICISE